MLIFAVLNKSNINSAVIVVAAWRSGGLPAFAASHLTCCLVALSNEPHPPLRQTAR